MTNHRPTKQLANPIGLYKTQASVRELVQNMKNIWDRQTKLAGLHCGPEHHKEMDLESAMKFFQLSMYAGMLALLDEGDQPSTGVVLTPAHGKKITQVIGEVKSSMVAAINDGQSLVEVFNGHFSSLNLAILEIISKSIEE